MSHQTTETVPATAVDEPLLQVRNLSVRYSGAGGDHVAVEGAGFELRAGQRMALVGQSGSGKSTLALAVTGLLGGEGVDVTADALTFEGRPVTYRHRGAVPVRTPGVAMVFQDAMTALDPVTPVGRQLLGVVGTTGLRGSRARRAAEEWLERVGLHDTRRVMRSRPHELSGGMRQRVMIAVALAGRPRLLVADEPTSALDASLARGTMELLQELTASEGVALLIISHDVLLCLDHSDVVGVMYDGRLVELAPAAALRTGAAHPYTRALVECVPTLADRSRPWLPTLADVVAREGQGAGVPLPRG